MPQHLYFTLFTIDFSLSLSPKKRRTQIMTWIFQKKKPVHMLIKQNQKVIKVIVAKGGDGKNR